jgi:hypothetical protein
VGEHVDVVQRRDREADLELARQVGLAVDRLDFLAAAADAFLVQPDLVVGAGVRQQVLRHRRGLCEHLRCSLRMQRIGRHQHVAVDVAAGRQRVDQRGVDRLHRALSSRLTTPWNWKAWRVVMRSAVGVGAWRWRPAAAIAPA